MIVSSPDEGTLRLYFRSKKNPIAITPLIRHLGLKHNLIAPVKNKVQSIDVNAKKAMPWSSHAHQVQGQLYFFYYYTHV